MRKPLKRSLLTASLVLVGASALGCSGGQDGAPTDASEKEFCAGINSLFEDLAPMADSTDKEAIATIKSWGQDMQEVGTPESISEDGRDGFELMTKQVGELEVDDSVKDFDKLEDDLSDDEKKAIEEFDKYTTDTCGEVGLETPQPTG